MRSAHNLRARRKAVGLSEEILADMAMCTGPTLEASNVPSAMSALTILGKWLLGWLLTWPNC